MKDNNKFVVNVNINITFSKIMAFIMLLASSVLAYKTKDASIFSNSLYVIGVLVVGRQGFNAIKQTK